MFWFGVPFVNVLLGLRLLLNRVTSARCSMDFSFFTDLYFDSSLCCQTIPQRRHHNDQIIVFFKYYFGYASGMPKISLDMPNELLTDIKKHVGDDKKFISVADVVRSACRKLLDQLMILTCDMGELEEI